MTEIRTPWLTASLIGVAAAAVTGGIAAWFTTEGDPTLRFIVFAVMTLPVGIGAGALLLAPTATPEHHEDSVESAWMTQASSGAFLDLLLALGLATTATAVLDTAPVPTVVFCVLGMADVALRYALLQRKEG